MSKSNEHMIRSALDRALAHRMSRRGWLLGGAATVGAGLGAGFLGSNAAHAEVGTPKNLIIVNAVGGWDTTYAIDPKDGVAGIDAPSDGTILDVGGITLLDAATRPDVTGFFEDFGDITTVVNGVQTSSISHTAGYRRIMTGSASLGAPDIGTINAIEHGADLAAPYLVLGTVSFSGPYGSAVTRTGNLNQLSTLLQPESGFPLEDGTFGFERFVPTNAEDALILDHMRESAAAVQGRWGSLGRNSARGSDFGAAIERGKLLADIGGLEGFDYAQSLAFQVDLAVDALASGMSQSCEIEMTGWDTHTANAQQGPLWQGFFAELRRLVTRLDDQGLLEDTVIAVVSEMGRTPKLNSDAGKDHWPVTSAMVISTDIGGGRVLGGTTEAFGGRNVDLATGEPAADGAPLRHSNLAAGLLELVGVDPEPHLGGVTPLRGW